MRVLVGEDVGLDVTEGGVGLMNERDNRVHVLRNAGCSTPSAGARKGSDSPSSEDWLTQRFTVTYFYYPPGVAYDHPSPFIG
jgi:hypothetical protein